MKKPLGVCASYAGLTAKRYFKLTPFILIMTVLLLVVLSVVFASFMTDSKTTELDNTVTIAVAGDVDDVYLQTALTAVEKMDLTKYSMKFPVMSEAEAKEQFEKSLISGYIVFPEGFMRAARAGEVGELYYVTSSGAATLASRYTAEMIKAITSMVYAAQKATYGFEGFALDRGMTYDELIPRAEIAVAKYIGVLVNRGKLYDVESTGVSGTDSEVETLVAGFVTVFLSLWGITCCTVATKKDKYFFRSMRAGGVGATAQVAAEFAAYLVFFLTTVAAVAALGALFLTVYSAVAPGVVPIGAKTVLKWASALPLPILVLSSMQFFLYEATSGIQNGVLAQFLTGVLLGFLSGCLYPPYFFPETAQRIGELLPAGAVRSFIAGTVSSSGGTARPALVALCWFSLFFALSVFFREIKIRGSQEG